MNRPMGPRLDPGQRFHRHPPGPGRRRVLGAGCRADQDGRVSQLVRRPAVPELRSRAGGFSPRRSSAGTGTGLSGLPDLGHSGTCRPGADPAARVVPRLAGLEGLPVDGRRTASSGKCSTFSGKNWPPSARSCTHRRRNGHAVRRFPGSSLEQGSSGEIFRAAASRSVEIAGREGLSLLAGARQGRPGRSPCPPHPYGAAKMGFPTRRARRRSPPCWRIKAWPGPISGRGSTAAGPLPVVSPDGGRCPRRLHGPRVRRRRAPSGPGKNHFPVLPAPGIYATMLIKTITLAGNPPRRRTAG